MGRPGRGGPAGRCGAGEILTGGPQPAGGVCLSAPRSTKRCFTERLAHQGGGQGVLRRPRCTGPRWTHAQANPTPGPHVCNASPRGGALRSDAARQHFDEE
ncbi:hypothetical protein E2562_036041 [Oryza meyeriana var. granulata]|uniref:Uncharacterized protein n=1 Tax=Oryza meyeriana var. granulata TaxID=110450 RepID=A0A6G1DAF7_9ORYZ|nr:hypothetical protein E2562_036041 [Oryza meyeriana var. granulata]